MDQPKKKSSRDAARQRRGQQNGEYGELALQLPLPMSMIEKLDRLCVMRLSNAYIKIKHILYEIEDGMDKNNWGVRKRESGFNSLIQEALGGFVFVLAEDGQILFVSTNVIDSLGLSQLDLTGQNIYKYVHPCDQENLALQLGGHVPLTDMEIFDGLFCADAPAPIYIAKQAKGDFEGSSHRSFFLRMKSTLTSRGKCVNINSSIHRVIQCTGTMQMYRMKRGISDGSFTRCFIGVGTPLLSNATFEVPIDRTAFITKHALDMNLTAIEKLGISILGYNENTLLKTSWYKYCHICDLKVLKNCHNVALQQGQSVSCYYRLMVKHGGWIWVETKANVVYAVSSRKPSYIICTHYKISGLELEGNVLSMEQISGVSKGKKREFPYERKPATVEENGPPTMILKTEGDSPVYEYNFSDENGRRNGVNFRLPKGNKPVPKAEVQPSLTVEFRSPKIPYPFLDAAVKLDSLDSDEDAPAESDSSMEEDKSTRRSPGVPSPTLDTILTFDELYFPDSTDSGYQMIDFGSDSPTTICESFDNFDELDFHDLGNIKVPSYLLPLQDNENEKLIKLEDNFIFNPFVEMLSPPITVLDDV